MIIIPLIFSIVIAIFLIGINLEKSGLGQYNSDEITDSEAQQVFKELVSVLNDALNHPDKFEDLEYLKNIDSNLKTLNLSFCFTIDNNIYYLSDNIDRLKFQKHIIINADKNETEQENTFGSLGYINYKFELSGGKKGVIYVFLIKARWKNF